MAARGGAGGGARRHTVHLARVNTLKQNSSLRVLQADGSHLYWPHMDVNAEVLRLQNQFAVANTECTAALNEQFLALIAGNENLELFNERIARAQELRQRAMDSLLNYIRLYGWR